MSPPALLLAAAAQGQPGWVGLLPMILIFGIMYVLLFLPMRRRQKALQKLIEDLKRGDKVITNGGIYGQVAQVSDKTLKLKVADNVKIEVSRSAIAGFQPGEAPAAPAGAKES